MDFSLTEDQKMLRTMVQDFAERDLRPIAREDDRNQNYRPEIVKKMASLGLVAGMLPKDYGGSGLDNISYAIVAEEVGKVDFAYVTSVFMVQHSLVELTLLRWGTKPQKDKYLPRLASGDLMGCFGGVEPNVGSDAAAVETSAQLDGHEWVLNGTKSWVSNGNIADLALILARIKGEEKKLAVFLTDTRAPGFKARAIKGKMGVRAMNTAEVSLDQCHVPEENMIGQSGQGLKVMLSAIDGARFTLAAGCVGLAQACIDASVRYAKERKQFGRPIGGFQLIQDKIADMIVGTEAARYLVYRVAYLRDKGLPHHRETAVAKYYASRVATETADKAIQIHGGYGYSDEFPVERYYRDSRIAPLVAGTNEIQKLIIAEEALGIRAIV